MVYPAALNFLIDYGKQFQPMITIGEYTDLFLTIMIGMGVIFELPILVFFLALMGIVNAGWMWRNLRYSILVIFIIAAIITPTTDILNMCIFAAPMVALYMLSIGIAWLVHPKQRKARQARKSDDNEITTWGQPRPAVRPSPARQALRTSGCEGGTPSRQPAGRRRYGLVAVLLGLVVCVQQASAQSFNSARAMQYTREVVAFGPRPIGSANHKKLENYILTHLKGDSVEDDAFTADTTEGKFPVRNIIAKFPGTRDGIIVIAGHYDTNYPLRNTGYVGANDGGSSTAILLELANQLRGKKRDGYSVWLLWTDGEEAVRTWTATDSLYGVRHLAEKWQQDGTLKKIRHFCWQT